MRESHAELLSSIIVSYRRGSRDGDGGSESVDDYGDANDANAVPIPTPSLLSSMLENISDI